MKYKIKNNIPWLSRIVLVVFLFVSIIPQTLAEANDAQQAGITVKGVVTDNLNEPLVGVSILIKGASTGTITDGSGSYSLNLSNGNETLVFSYIGFQTQEIPVNNRTSINVVMQDDVENVIPELVVVGYGVQKKVNLTGSVASVDAAKIENRATTNLSTSLASLTPGVNVTQKSGAPGDEKVDFIVRGPGSFNGTGPLVIIDGAEGSMNSVNQDDVASISFLKDGASASIYGARAANGVILITTKRGKTDQKPRVTYSNVFASQKAQTKWKLMSDMPTWMEWHNQAVINNNVNADLWFSQSLIDTWRNANANPNSTDNEFGIPNSIAYPNTDWAQEIFKSSFFQRHNLSVSGGSKNSNYLLSLGFQDNPGTFANTAQQRFNIRANVETTIADRVKFGTQTYATKTKQDVGDTDLAFRFLAQAYPGMNPKIDGLYGAAEESSMAGMNNPLRNIDARGGKTEETTINTTWFANVDIWNGLSAEARFNYQNIFFEQNYYDKNVPLYRFRNGTAEPVENIGSLANATTTRKSRTTERYVLNFLLHYNKTFGDHDISALLGYEQTQWNKSAFQARRKGLIDWSITDITSATNMDQITGEAKVETAMVSYFGRVNYSYKSKYLFEANLRTDGSSQYAPGNRWGYFPSFSGGWRISEEEFYQPFRHIIEDAKIRASWGMLGYIPSNSGYYPWQALYGKTDGVLGEAISSGLAQTQPSSAALKWEKVATTDLGLDLYALNRRLSVVFDYYYKKSSDILAQPPMPLSMGFIQSNQWLNTADMVNKGFEFAVGWNDKIDKVQYGISLNASYNSNKVTKYRGALNYGDTGQKDKFGNPVYGYTNLGSVGSPYDNDRQYVVEDKMFKEFYLSVPYSGSGNYYTSTGAVDPNGGPTNGMIRTKADLEWAQAMLDAGYSFGGKKVSKEGKGSDLWYGDQILADLNGDGIYGDSNDRKFTGKSTLPKWMFGFNINAAWNNFDFSMSWDARIGSYAYLNATGVNGNITLNYDGINADAGSLYYTYDATQSVNNYDNYDPATDPNANINGRYPRLLTVSSSTPANTLYLLNTSYLKLRTLQIGYTLPKQLLEKIGLASVRVFVSGENLITIKHKDFIGVDPELGSSVNVYPISRMYSGGINVTF